MSSALMAFLHHAAAFMLVAVLTAEHALFDPRPSPATARRLVRLDMLYGLSAMALLGIGFLRAIYFEKGWVYYIDNPYFVTKVVLFVAVGILSAWPTALFLSWRKALAAGRAPEVAPSRARTVTLLMRVQLALVVAILFCAALMAKGVA